MRHQLRVPSRLSSIVGLGLLVASTSLLWAQRPPPHAVISSPLLSSTVMATVPDPTAEPPHVRAQLQASFRPHQGMPDPPLKFAALGNSSHQEPINNHSAFVLRQATRGGYLTRKSGYFGDYAQRKQLSFESSNKIRTDWAPRRADDLEFYCRHTPWAGSIILRIDKQANAHPRVTRILKILKPRI